MSDANELLISARDIFLKIFDTKKFIFFFIINYAKLTCKKIHLTSSIYFSKNYKFYNLDSFIKDSSN